MTTLDEGDISRDISGINFSSRADWIVGKDTEDNLVRLEEGSSATILAGKHVYVGQNAGSDGNTLQVAGSIVADEIFVGSISGNERNTLIFEETATLSLDSINLTEGNLISLQGDYSDISALLGFFSTNDVSLYVYTLDWTLVDESTYETLIAITSEGGYTNITAIPEPSALTLAGVGLLAIGCAACRRAKRA